MRALCGLNVIPHLAEHDYTSSTLAVQTFFNGNKYITPKYKYKYLGCKYKYKYKYSKMYLSTSTSTKYPISVYFFLQVLS